jgi:DNA-binding response OmpR family regulator
MRAEDRPPRWREVWEQRRVRCVRQDELDDVRSALPREAIQILDETRALAAIDDPQAHADADVEGLIDRVNALGGSAPVLLHGVVSNGLSMLRIAAQELLAARAPGSPSLPPTARRRSARLSWFVVVGEEAELVELATECSVSLAWQPPVRVARTLEDGLDLLRTREGTGVVITGLILRSDAGRGDHGLQLAAEARRRRHAVVLVTAASDYLPYWPRLASVGLTGHDVVIKSRRDFSARLRRRLREIAEPDLLRLSYDESDHMVWIGDVEVAGLEAQEALVLHALDTTWRNAEKVADACREPDLAPTPGSVPPLISTLRRKLAIAMVEAESPHAPHEVIESRRGEGQPTQYRLAPWLRWDDPPDSSGAAGDLPPVVVLEDDRDWGRWVVSWLGELGWRATMAETTEEVWRALAADGPGMLIADLALRDPTTGQPDPDVGISLIEEMAQRHKGVRVVVLTAFGRSDKLLARLFHAGVRTIDVVDKAADADRWRAIVLSSLQRLTDEARRGVRRGREAGEVHRLVRVDLTHVEVDGHPMALSAREAELLAAMIKRPNLPIKAELLEQDCFPPGVRAGSSAGYSQMNKVHQAVKRLRRKIDAAVGRRGVGAALIRTPNRGTRTTYELSGLVTDLVEPEGERHAEPVSFLRERVSQLTTEVAQLRREVSDLRRTATADDASEHDDGAGGAGLR